MSLSLRESTSLDMALGLSLSSADPHFPAHDWLDSFLTTLTAARALDTPDVSLDVIDSLRLLLGREALLPMAGRGHKSGRSRMSS